MLKPYITFAMKHLVTLLAALFLLGGAASAQKLSKEEKHRIKKELRSYTKDPAGYKAKMEDVRTTIDSNDAQIKALRDDLAYAAGKQVELENKIADMDKALKEYQAKPVAECPDDMSKAPMGTVYKVQLGLYKEFNINKYFEQPRAIGYEEVDGMNRYIVSYFPDEKIAKDFVADIRKMGIKDAFVSKYIDGVRVYEWNKNPKFANKPEPKTLQEGLDAMGGSKKKKTPSDAGAPVEQPAATPPSDTPPAGAPVNEGGGN